MTEQKNQCSSCDIDPDKIWFESDCGIAIWDGFPVAKGHSLVVPGFHVSSLFDLESEAQAALWKMVGEVRSRLYEELQPDGFNIGLNDGKAAGQTVMHAHIHVVPRWTGDVADPRGGVRWIIPEKARYWGDE